MARVDVMILVTTLGQGGTERYAKDLAIGLAQRHVRPCVVYDNPPEYIKHEIESAGIPTYCIGDDNTGNRTRYAARLTALLRDLQQYTASQGHTWDESYPFLSIQGTFQDAQVRRGADMCF